MNREELQDLLVEKYVTGKRKGIFVVSVRSGKTRVGVRIIKELKYFNILIAYPDKVIKKSWLDEFDKIPVEGNVTYTTFRSLHKFVGKYDLVIVD